MSPTLADLTTEFTEEQLLQEHGLLDQLRKSCEVCAKPADKICTTCYGAWYCSPEHEASDLDTHRYICSSPMEVRTDEIRGRHYVASRDLEAGAILIQEPSAFGVPRAEPNDDTMVYCLGCCIGMEVEDGYRRCSLCRWPVCSSACEKNPVHAEQECELFAEHHVAFPRKFDYQTTYKGVFTIRGLMLREKNPELWAKIQTLDHVIPKLGKISYFPDLGEYKRLFGIPQDFGGTVDDWNKIQGVCNVNAFWTDLDSRTGNFVFIKSSIFSQSCAPNAYWNLRINKPNPGEGLMEVRTTTPITKGEIIGIAYCVEGSLKGTYQRQNEGFICKCARCEDPTELGSYSAAMKCPKQGCSGNILPATNPQLKESQWKCDKDGCTVTIPGPNMIQMLGLMTTALENLPLGSVENYIRKELDKVLQPNHWILVKASARIVLETDIGQVNQLDGAELDRYIFHCQRMLHVYDIIQPGLSKNRGIALRALGPPLFRKLCSELTDENVMDILAALLKVYDSLKESFLCLKDVPMYTPVPPDNYDARTYSILLGMNAIKAEIKDLTPSGYPDMFDSHVKRSGIEKLTESFGNMK